MLESSTSPERASPSTPGSGSGTAKRRGTRAPSPRSAGAECIFASLFRDLCNKDVAEETRILQRCLVVYYARYLKADRLISMVRREVRVGYHGTGALRFLASWTRSRYSLDVRPKKKLRKSLCDLALLRVPRRSNAVPLTKEDERALREELNLLKLAIIAGAARGLTRQGVKRLFLSPHLTGAIAPLMLSERASTSGGAGTHLHDRNVGLLMTTDAHTIAFHLLLLNYESFSRINMAEFYNGWSDEVNAPTLHAFKQRIINLTSMVATAILVQSTVRMQRKVAIHFITIANFARDFGDLAGCIAIMQAFAIGPVSRIRKPWQLAKNYTALASDLNTLIDASGNYKAQREFIAARIEDRKVCVPHLGIYQRDLTLIEEGNPSFKQNGAVNGEKIVLIGSRLWELDTLQSIAPRGFDERRIERIPALVRILTLLPHKDDAALDALSERIRPRNNVACDSPVTEDTSSSTVSTETPLHSTRSGGTNINEESSSSADSEAYVDI